MSFSRIFHDKAQEGEQWLEASVPLIHDPSTLTIATPGRDLQVRMSRFESIWRSVALDDTLAASWDAPRWPQTDRLDARSIEAQLRTFARLCADVADGWADDSAASVRCLLDGGHRSERSANGNTLALHASTRWWLDILEDAISRGRPQRCDIGWQSAQERVVIRCQVAGPLSGDWHAIVGRNGVEDLFLGVDSVRELARRDHYPADALVEIICATTRGLGMQLGRLLREASR